MNKSNSKGLTSVKTGAAATMPKQLSFSRLWVEAPPQPKHVPRRRQEEAYPDKGKVAEADSRHHRMTGRLAPPDSDQATFEITNDRNSGVSDFSEAQTIPRLRELLNRNWPEAAYGGRNGTAHRFRINLPALAAIFPHTGIPYGQIIEISGGISSGKTALLQRLVAAIEPAPAIGYLDFSSSFFPPGAEAAGIDLKRLKLIRPDNLQNGIRVAEALLQQRQISCLVFDLVGISEPLPRILLHRLRQNIIKGEAIGFFLTETGSRHLPASYASLRLQTARTKNHEIAITATRNRIGREGACGRMSRV